MNNKSLYARRPVYNGILYPRVCACSCTQQALLLQPAELCMSCRCCITGHQTQGTHGLMLCHDKLLQITHGMLNIHDHDINLRAPAETGTFWFKWCMHAV